MVDLDAQLSKVLDEIAEAVHDGVDVEDVALVVRKSMEVAEKLDDVSGADKSAFAETLAAALLDRFLAQCTPALAQLIEEIDVPFLPEAVERATIDPLLRAWTPTLLRAVLRRALPSLFTLVVDATRGELAVNGKVRAALADQVDGALHQLLALQDAEVLTHGRVDAHTGEAKRALAAVLDHLTPSP